MLKRSKKIVSLLLVVLTVFSVLTKMYIAVDAYSNKQIYVVDGKIINYKYKDYNGNQVDVTYRIPRIVLEGTDAELANEKSEQIFNDKCKSADDMRNFKAWELQNTKLDYECYINDNVLSVIILDKYPFNNYTEYTVYNFDVLSGKRLYNEDIANRLSLNYSKIKNVIIEEIQNYFNSLPHHSTFYYEQLEKSISEDNIENSSLYIGENGQIMVKYRIYQMAGSETYYYLMSIDVSKVENFFKLRKDTNQYLHKSTTYYVNNKEYRNKLYWDSLNTWDSTFRIHDEIYSGETGGVCHGIALSMCYANNGNLDLKALNNGIQTSNYWGLGSIYDSDKSKFKDLVTYYQLTQSTANGRESYSVTKNGWHTQSLDKRLSDFLKKFKQEAECSQNEKKPFVFSFGYKHNDEVSGHSVVACGYNYNKSTNEHEILIYDENTYPSVRYFTFKISSDYSSFTFTDANGEALGYMVSDIWTYLKVYSIDKLYSGKAFSSITVVKGSEPVSASNTTQINITAYKKFKMVNEKGEYLEYDGNNYSGNMNVYNCKLVDNLDNTCSWDITVNKSSKFEFSNLENDCEIIGETYSGGFYISSNDSDGFIVNGKSVTVEGENYDFDIALQTQSEKDFIRVSGKASGNTSVSDNNNKIEMKSDTYINAANVKSYEFDNISENDVENTVNNIIIDDESGKIVDSKKLSYTFGDINNDGTINSKDRMTLTRYIAKWNGVKTINNQASDVNYDGKVNAKDRMILTRHLAKWQRYETLPLK